MLPPGVLDGKVDPTLHIGVLKSVGPHTRSTVNALLLLTYLSSYSPFFKCFRLANVNFRQYVLTIFIRFFFILARLSHRKSDIIMLYPIEISLLLTF
ncbi:unnamed protein product [Acanthoscelides obtectus]|uniref:Uncharacterized protein n=1 Tax=Acanthoscelides obtectus TaxID=200917 RepID=A0A9P0P0J7_ACAOB|nr:unnamed protein product [Acanthoscelides obtectus]CAK1647194.1 hypothetical protein AOBTE_LOCUS15098 [Acanthoscelides obtectus]